MEFFWEEIFFKNSRRKKKINWFLTVCYDFLNLCETFGKYPARSDFPSKQRDTCNLNVPEKGF